MRHLSALSLFLITSLAMGFLTSCSGSKMSVNRATQQKYYGGPAGSGGGIIYRAYIEKGEKAELSIDKVWVGNDLKGYWANFKVHPDSSNSVLRDHIIPRGTTLARIEFSVVSPMAKDPQGGEYNGPEPTEPITPSGLPESFKKGLVIFYTPASGNSGYWIVEEFKKLEPLLYP